MEISQKHKDILDSIYFNQSGGAAAFSTLRPLYEAANHKDHSITVKVVKQYLMTVQPYLSHKRILRVFPRRSMSVVFYPGEYFAADLVFYLQDKSPENRNFSYCLNVVDVFSKYGYSRGLPSKHSSVVLSAFKSILDEAKTVPSFLFLDSGIIILI